MNWASLSRLYQEKVEEILSQPYMHLKMVIETAAVQFAVFTQYNMGALPHGFNGIDFQKRKVQFSVCLLSRRREIH